MGHHINENGYFQSDKHPELKEHQIILNFRDEFAQQPLLDYALATNDIELAADITAAVNKVREDGLTKKPNE